MSSSEAELDWSYLPLLPLYIILHELNDILDRISFSLVCRHWNLAYCHMKGNQPDVQLIPILLIPTSSECDPWAQRSGEKRSLYCVTQEKLFKGKVDLGDYKLRFSGSRYGLLAGVRKVQDEEKAFVIILMDPFKRHPDIELPPLLYLLGPFDEQDYSVRKVVLTKDPTSYPKDYVVVAILKNSGRLAIFKAGQHSWTVINEDCNPDPSFLHFCDAIVYKDSILAVGRRNNLVSVQFRGDSLVTKDLSPSGTLGFNTSSTWTYLAENSKGELLLVLRFRDDESKETSDFKIFKLTLDDETGKLVKQVEKNNLDGDVLFLGDSYSTSFPSSKLSGMLMPNSIYYTDVSRHYSPDDGPIDSGVYYLDYRLFGKHYILDSKSDSLWPPTIWIVPPF